MSGGRDDPFCQLSIALLPTGWPPSGGPIAAPLTNVETIRRRHDAVACLSMKHNESVRRYLAKPDMERAMSRLTLERGSPCRLGALRNGLSVASALRAQLRRGSARAKFS